MNWLLIYTMYEIEDTSLTLYAFPWPMRTYFMEAPFALPSPPVSLRSVLLISLRNQTPPEEWTNIYGSGPKPKICDP